VYFQLVYGDFEYPLLLPFEEHVEERLLKLVSQEEPGDASEMSRKDLARRLVDLITALLECEVLAPTERQIKYAVAIAKELSLEIPPEVLQYRASMTVFLGTHSERYRRRKGYAEPARGA